MAVLWLALLATANCDHLFYVNPALYFSAWGAFVIVYRQALRGWALALMLYFHTLDLSWLFLMFSSLVSFRASWVIWIQQSEDVSPVFAMAALLSGVVMSFTGCISPWIFRQCSNPLARVQWRYLLLAIACSSFVTSLCCDAQNMHDYGLDSLRWPTLYFSWIISCSLAVYGVLTTHKAHLQDATKVPCEDEAWSIIIWDDNDDDVFAIGKATEAVFDIVSLHSALEEAVSCVQDEDGAWLPQVVSKI